MHPSFLIVLVLLGHPAFSQGIHDSGAGSAGRPQLNAGPSPERLTEQKCSQAFGAEPTEETVQEAREYRMAARAGLCQCLKDKRTSTPCRTGGQIDKWLEELTEGVKGEPLASTVCGKGLIEQQKEYLLSFWEDACREGTLKPELFQLPRGDRNACWQLSAIRPDGCVIATPRGSGPADLSRLPAAKSGLASEAVLCNPRLSRVHQLKDPDGLNQAYQAPKKNFLFSGHYQNHTTYGPANCHGTAAGVVGPLFRDVELEGITYHSQEVEQRCGALARRAFERGRKDGKVTVESMGEPPISINMTHAGCRADQCGTAKLSVFDCSGGKLISSAFFEGMCEECWVDRFKRHGYRELGAQNNWQDLQPGCVLTANDHSVTVLMQDCGWCYFYESTTPFGPPQLRMSLCPALWSRFPRKLCPSSPSGSLRFQ